MVKKKLLALLLSLMLSFYSFPAWADEIDEASGNTAGVPVADQQEGADFIENAGDAGGVDVVDDSSQDLIEAPEEPSYDDAELPYEPEAIDDEELSPQAEDATLADGEPEAIEEDDVELEAQAEGEEEPFDPTQWLVSDFFIVDGTVVGLTDDGISKRATLKDLVIPAKDADGFPVRAIAASDNYYGGVFATETEQFDSVVLPDSIKVIGSGAFCGSGISSIVYPKSLTAIGAQAFACNNLTEADVPDTVTDLGQDAYASNPLLTYIHIPAGLTVIPDGAFGCSDAEECMEGLVSIEIPEGVTTIGNNAFAGNNFSEIVLPSTVVSVGDYAFSTKSFLMGSETECTVVLPEGLQTIGEFAFLNKAIGEVQLPTTVASLPDESADPFAKDETLVTTVYVSSIEQFSDKGNFADTRYRQMVYDGAWTTGDFTYDGTTVTGLSDVGKQKLLATQALVIPDQTPDGQDVTAIGDGVRLKGTFFTEVDGALYVPTSVVFPASLQSIGNNAFSVPTGHDGLTSVDFPDSVTSIGVMAFAEAPIDGELVLPPGLTELGASAFMCGDVATAEISSVVIPGTLTTINYATFAGQSITELVIPEGVTSIDKMAFFGNEITSLSLPSTLESIGDSAFRYHQLTSLEIPGSVKSVGERAFDTSGTTGLELDKTLTTLTLNEGLQTIGSQAFGNSNIPADARVALPSTVMTLPEDAFSGSTDTVILATGTPLADLPPDVSVSGDNHQVIYEEAYGVWNASDFTFDDETVTGLSDAGEAKLAVNPHVVIPDKNLSGDTVTAIGDSSFQMLGLSSVTFPDTITSIGTYAFAQASLKGELVLPESLTSLEEGAFCGRSDQDAKITSVVFPSHSGLESIPKEAFAYQEIREIRIPEDVKTVGDYAFYANRSTVIELPSTLETIANYAFTDQQAADIEIPSSVKTIGSYAFSSAAGQPMPTSLTLNEGLETISAAAFERSGVETVDLPSTVKFLDKDAFRLSSQTVLLLSDKPLDQLPEGVAVYGSGHEVAYFADVWFTDDFTYDGTTVTGLSDTGKEKLLLNQDLVIPDKTPDGQDVTAIGPGAADEGTFFARQDSVTAVPTSVVFPAKLQSIGDSAFCGCPIGDGSGNYAGLTTVEFPGTLTSIGAQAFQNAPIEGEVALPLSLSSLGTRAFQTSGSAKITAVNIPPAISLVPSYAFYGQGIEQVIVPQGITVIAMYAFAENHSTEISLPTTLTDISSYSFMNHQAANLDIPASVVRISAYAFAVQDESLQPAPRTLTLHEGLGQFGNGAFSHSALTTVHLPSSVGLLPRDTFKNSTQTVLLATSVPLDRLPHNVVVHGDGHEVIASTELSTLPDVSITVSPTMCYWTGEPLTPEVAVSVGDQTLAEGVDYKVLYVNNVNVGTAMANVVGIGKYNGIVAKRFEIYWDDVWYEGDFTFDGSTVTGLTTAGKAKIAANPDMVIPDKNPDGQDVTAIGSYAFQGMENPGGDGYCGPSSVVFPDTVTSIQSNAFENAPLQGELVLPSALTEIQAFAFAYTDLVSTELPDGVSTLSAQAFEGSSQVVAVYTHLPLASLPEGVVVHGNRHEVFSMVEGPWGIDDFTFDGTTVTGLTDYGQAKLAENTDLVIPEQTPDGQDVTAIGPGTAGKGTFFVTVGDDTTVPTSVVLPDTLTDIGDFAFCGCPSGPEATSYTGLGTVEIPATVTSIGEGAFQNAPLAGELVLPEGLANLGMAAFATVQESQAKVTSVNIPAGIVDIPEAAFAHQGISEIVLAEGVLTVGREAFSGNMATTIELPTTLTSIGNEAFMNHQAASISIPGSVETVGDYAFCVLGEGPDGSSGEIGGSDGQDSGDNPSDSGNQASTGPAMELQPAPAELVLDEGLASIGTQAFGGSAIERVSLPSSVETLDAQAFSGSVEPVGVVTGTPDAYDVPADDSHYFIVDLSRAENVAVAVDPERSYWTGREAQPQVSVSYNEELLEPDVDYTLIGYENNVNLGNATVTVEGLGDFAGLASCQFPIYWNTITKNAGDGGRVELQDGLDAQGNVIDGSMHAKPGTTVVFRTIPDPGMTLATFNVTYIDPQTGKKVVLITDKGITRLHGTGHAGTISEYSFPMPDCNVTINATFKANENKYAIVKNITGNAASTSKLMLVGSDGKPAGETSDAVAPTMQPTAGSKVYFKSVPGAGAKLTKFSVTYTYELLDGTTAQRVLTVGNGGITKMSGGVYCFTMPAYKVTMNAEFRK